MGSGRSNRGGSPTRRAVLLAAGAAVAGAADVVPSGAVTRGFLTREEEVDIVQDLSGVLALAITDPVERNTRQLLVDVTNNFDVELSVTVALTTCSDGTLYDEQGDSGCSVTQPIGAGNTRGFEIDPAVTGDIAWTVTATAAGVAVSAPRTVLSQNNVSNAITIQDFMLRSAFSATDTLTVQKAQAQDNDGDDDLTRTEYTVRDPNGNVVGTETHSYAATNQYHRNNFSFAATMDPGVEYAVTMEVFDVDGNKNQTTRTIIAT